MKRCLIVSGGYTPHRAVEAGERVRTMLEEDGFDVRHAETLDAYEHEDLASYSLIVPNWTLGQMSTETAKRLWAAIYSGTGLGGFHGGMVDGFRDNDRFRYMVGGAYVREPGGICRYRVEIIRKDDPIMNGLSDFDYHSEQYYLHVDPVNEILATTRFTAEHDPWIDGVVMPVVWKKPFGNGRVFFSALGHVPEEFDNPSMSTILRRGLNWASRDHSH